MRKGVRPRRLPRAQHLLLRGRRPVPAGGVPRRGGGRHRPLPRRDGEARPGLRRRRAAPPQRAALQLRTGGQPRPDPRRGAQELPPQLPRILREALVRLRHRPERHRHRRGGRDRAVRHRPGLRRRGPRRLHLPRRDLRGLLGAAAALDLGRARRGADPVQPLRVQHHDRQGGRAQIALRRPLEPLQRRLRLRRVGAGREHHRPRLGRPERDLRVRRAARRIEPLRHGAGAVRRRRRRPAAPARADADADLQRQCRRRRPSGEERPAHPFRAPAGDGRYRLRAAAAALPLRAEPARAARPGLLRSVQHPGPGPRQAVHDDQRRPSRDRRLGRARFDPCFDRRREDVRLPEAPALDHPRLHHAGLRHRRHDQDRTPGR
jgi:hypothetical protein